jgi:hypothetical protein
MVYEKWMSPTSHGNMKKIKINYCIHGNMKRSKSINESRVTTYQQYKSRNNLKNLVLGLHIYISNLFLVVIIYILLDSSSFYFCYLVFYFFSNSRSYLLTMNEYPMHTNTIQTGIIRITPII